MKALSLSILVLAALAVACAPQRRTPTARSVKNPNALNQQKTSVEQPALSQSGTPTIQGSIKDLGIPAKKNKTSIQGIADIKEVTTVIAEPSANTKSTQELPGFKIQVTANNGEQIAAKVDNKPGQELEVSSVTAKGKKRIVDSNVEAVDFKCLDAQRAIKMSDCKKLSVTLTAVGEKKGIVIKIIRELSTEVDVAKVEGDMSSHFGRAQFETFTTKINDSPESKVTRVISVVGDGQNLDNLVSNTFENLNGIDTKITVAGLTSSSPITSRFSLMPKSARVNGETVEVVIGINLDPKVDKATIAGLKTLDDELNLKLLIQPNAVATSIPELEQKKEIEQAVAKKEIEAEQAKDKMALIPVENLEPIKLPEEKQNFTDKLVELPVITAPAAKKPVANTGAAIISDLKKEESNYLPGISGEITAP